MPTGKARGLLAVLALHANQAVSSEALANELWLGEPPAQARAALRVHVSHLRKSLQPLGAADGVQTHASAYLLVLEADAVDADRFASRVAAGSAALAAGDLRGAVEELERAQSLWRGDPLCDVEPLPCVAAARLRLQEQRVSALELRVDAGLELGHHARLVGELEHLTAVHPLRERLWAQLMLALYRTGRQAEALRAYAELRALLADELGIEPGRQLADLQAAILRQDLALDARVPAPSRTGAPLAPGVLPPRGTGVPTALAGAARSSLVGRAAQRSALHHAWQQALAGEPTVVVLSGAAGAGKTRLAADLAVAVDSAGGTVAYGRCSDPPLLPFQPLAEALDAYVAGPGSRAVRSALDARGPDLEPVLPSLTPPTARPAAPPGLARYRLFEGVLALLAAGAAQAPVLLVLDDLHWADASTLELLRHLTGRLAPGTRILLLLVHRDLHGPALEDLLAELAQHSRPRRIAVPPLAVDEVAALLGGTAAAPVGSPLAVRVHAETGGNAFFVTELARVLAEADDPDPADGPLPVPDGVAAAVGGRAARLPHLARHLLDVAAVAGSSVDLALVAAAAGVDADDAEDALDAAVTGGFVVPAGRRRIAFDSELVRTALYDRIPPARRSRLHRRLAAALEDRGAGAGPGRLAALAEHWSRAAPGDQRALVAAQAAAESAAAAMAFEQAVQRYEQALEHLALWAGQHGPDEARRGALLAGLAAAYKQLGAVEAARDTSLEAAEAARAAGDADLLARVALGLAGRDRISPHATPEALQLLVEARAALAGARSARRVEVCARLAQLQSAFDHSDELVQAGVDAVHLARELGEPQTLAEALAARLAGLGGPAGARNRLAVADELLGMAGDDHELALLALDHRLWALAELGDEPRRREAAAAYQARARSWPSPQVRMFLTSHRLFPLVAGGRFSGVDAAVADAVEAARAVGGDAIEDSTRTTHLLLPRWLQGRLADVEPGLRRLRDWLPPAWVEAPLALLEAHTGDPDGARARIQSALDQDHLAQLPPAVWPMTAFALASACSVAGTPPQAEQVYALLRPHAERHCTYLGFAFYGAYAFHLGRLAATAGRPDLAAAHLETALDRHRAMGAEPWAAACASALARVLPSLADTTAHRRARTLGRWAEQAARRMGITVATSPLHGYGCGARQRAS